MKAFFEKFKSGLNITRTTISRSVSSIFSSNKPWTDDDYDELEAALIGSDLGISYTTRFVDDIRQRYNEGKISTAEDILQIAREDIISLMSDSSTELPLQTSGPTIILMVGVNGSGKTTTTGKLGKKFQDEGKKVMFAACDTFRAAAIEQLKVWGERTNIPVIAGKHGQDPASVAYDACKSAEARDIDILLIDTAGRQHTKKGLMDELEKVVRTIDKALPGAPHQTLLVVDGSAGSNGLMQAREFSKAAPLDGLCLTKLDGSGKGGIVVAIHEELALPVRYIGLGESPEDLQPFDPSFFAEAIFPEGKL
ncbi:MAG: signal recognition particle-docking protein FtsY [Lentisphaeria bacterium]|nr:signal recognition particle-docking protein FtsY [Lentisphaeria bacterium]